jgi:hypothetical protein
VLGSQDSFDGEGIRLGQRLCKRLSAWDQRLSANDSARREALDELFAAWSLTAEVFYVPVLDRLRSAWGKFGKH